jgi:hypothetical protein
MFMYLMYDLHLEETTVILLTYILCINQRELYYTRIKSK